MQKNKLPSLKSWARPAGISCDLAPSAISRWNAALTAKDDDNTISVLDPIGFDFWTGEGVTAKRVAAALRSIGDRDVVVNINSPGGDVFEGIAIYNILRDHPRNVTVRVLGLAASAASIVAMAGDRIEIARAGFMMIHNVWVVAMGNRNDLRDAAEMLEPFDSALADVYSARTGGERAAIAALMDKETWFSGQQAIDEGFADAFVPADEVEEKKSDEKPSAVALRRIEAHLVKAGMPRSERRALLKQVSGTPSAAADSMPGAGDEAQQFCERMRAAVTPIS
jgi:ATP-dependent Clp protease, protease subunit